MLPYHDRQIKKGEGREKGRNKEITRCRWWLNHLWSEPTRRLKENQNKEKQLFWKIALSPIFFYMLYHSKIFREFRLTWLAAASSKIRSLKIAAFIDIISLRKSRAKTIQTDHQGDLRKTKHAEKSTQRSYRANASKHLKKYTFLYFEPTARVSVLSNRIEDANT